MRIRLLAVGTRVPGWVAEGYTDYARRLPRECALELVEIAPEHRRRGLPVARAVEREGQRMQRALPAGARVVALDLAGQPWSTPELKERLRAWLGGGRDLALLVGGADGLWPPLRAQADEAWSLSPLTLPHALVRILVAEQIYRAWSLLRGHPYHR